MKCLVWEGCGWVCESHPERPWEGEHACTCGGAGMPCPKLQPCGRADGTEAARGFQDAGGQKRLAPLIPDKERTETSRSSMTRYFLSSAERPGGGSPKNSEVSDRGATN
jgi:hypothetical protein